MEKEKEQQTNLTLIFQQNTQPRGNQTWNPRPNQEQKVPNTLAPTNLVNQDIIYVTLKYNFHLFPLLHKHNFHL